MEYPKFKVCVRCFTFNQADYIEDAMNGFTMQQTDFPFVCCIVDDASTDGEQDVIKKYMDMHFDYSPNSVSFEKETDYAYIHYAQHKENKNCYFAVLFLKSNLYSKKENYLKYIYIAEWRESCEYEAICEGDDYWINPLKLHLQVDFLDRHPDFGMVRTDSNVYYQDINLTIDSVFKNKLYPNCEDTFVDYVVRPCWLATCSWLIRTPIGDYEDLPKDCFTGDLALMIYIAKKSKVKYLPVVTTVYRVLKNSASHFTNSADTLRFWKSQVNTRCYYARYLSFLNKIIMIKNILINGRHLFINSRTFNLGGFLNLSYDIILRVFKDKKAN